MPLHMRLPKLKGFRNRIRVESQVVNVGDLARLFPEGGEVGPAELVAAGAVREGSPSRCSATASWLGHAARSPRTRSPAPPARRSAPPAGRPRSSDPRTTPPGPGVPTAPRARRLVSGAGRDGPGLLLPSPAGPAPRNATHPERQPVRPGPPPRGAPRRPVERRSRNRRPAGGPSARPRAVRAGDARPAQEAPVHARHRRALPARRHPAGPRISYTNVQACLRQVQGGDAASVYSLINLFSGGALLQLSVFALGIMPYITASIIIQLLVVVIPRFEQLKKEGQSGQDKLTQYTPLPDHRRWPSCSPPASSRWRDSRAAVPGLRPVAVPDPAERRRLRRSPSWCSP